jgi:hypothetical protein
MSVGDRQWLHSEVGQCRRAREFGQLSEKPQEQLLTLVSKISECVKGKTHFDGCLLRIGAPAFYTSVNGLYQAENDVPQPQVPVALGLVNLKPPP